MSPLFILKKCLAFLPADHQVLRLNVIDQPGIRLNPFSLPFLAAHMLDDFDPMKRGICAFPLPQNVFLAYVDI
jgi:hypothetical protein